MQKLSVRIGLLMSLVAMAGGAGLLTWNADRRLQQLELARSGVYERVERLLSANAEITAAQRAYMAPGELPQQSFERVASLIQRLYDETAELPSDTALAGSVKAIVRADTLVRDNLRAGREAMAAALIFGEASRSHDGFADAARQLQAREVAALARSRADVAQQAWLAMAATAVLWLCGLLALLRVPRPFQVQSHVAMPASEVPVTDAAINPPHPEPHAFEVDLVAAAAVCTEMSRLTTSASLDDVLRRAAGVLGVPGLVVWMRAGQELCAAAAYGYDPRVVSRLGTIGRDDTNATAAAWRTGEVHTVAGDMVAPGAIVAPMFNSDGCIGVLAAEVAHTREADPTTRAVVLMFAAQLASALAAWPSTSLREPQPRSASAEPRLDENAGERYEARA